MPNDAKLGLVLGVALVLLIAVLFFRREPASATATQVKAEAPAQVVPALLSSNGQAERR
jgi:hypothetical protein